MRSIITRPGAREALWLSLGFWALYFVVLAAQNFGVTGTVTTPSVALFGAFALSGLVASAPIFLAVCWSQDLPAPRRGGLIIAVVLLVTVLNAIICSQISEAFMAIYSPQTPQARRLDVIIGTAQSVVAVHALYAAAIHLTLRGAADRARDHQLAEARATAHQATLAALRFQLNPHFLFNTLNAISSLVGAGRTAEAESMLQKLSDFLRSTLSSGAESMVTLDEELSAIETYLEIEGVRFADRMILRIECPPELRRARVPSLILQPLVENAVKYAVAPAVRAVTVSVDARQEGAVLMLRVQDDGAAAQGAKSAAAGGTGIGLANVRARLSALYGEAASLTTSRRPDGFTTCVTLPLDLAAAAVVRAA